jgi:quinol monooxygenase YgiN
MTQANGIVLRIRPDKADEFERLFAEEEIPIWDEFSERGKFLIARLARVEYGTEEAEREDVAVYLLYIEVPGMTEHTEHDQDPRFKAYLEKVLPLHAEPPLVFGGDILFERRAT